MTYEKLPFLVAYDYGTGGLWGVLFARSEDEIHERYPELQIAHERPHWMSRAYYAGLLTTEAHDIDGPVDGLLKAVVADRGKS